MSRAPYLDRVACATVLLISSAIATARTVDVSPYPILAGEPVTVLYDPSGRPLDGAAAVYAHYGFNDWTGVPADDPSMTWNASASAWEITLDVPDTAQQFDIVFNDGAGTWDNNNGADWHLFVIGSQAKQWTLDGEVDDDAVLIAANGGVQLYAGVRNGLLYLAAPRATAGNDHFIFVTDVPGGQRAAPWDKTGTVANWSTYIGNEVDNGWVGWFSADGDTSVTASGWIEATLDLAGEFGAVPSQIHLAFAAYETAVDGLLQPALQVPGSQDGNGNINAGEYLAVNVADIATGCFPLDLDRDCDVDADDYLRFVGCLGEPLTATCTGADLDGDNDVDLGDFARLQVEAVDPMGTGAVTAEGLSAGAARFYPADVDLADLPPSMSLATTPTVEGPKPKPWAVWPHFFQSGDRHVALIEVDDNVSLYGTGEVCGGLLRNGHTTEAWNTDAYGYGPGNPSLYQSHPWVLGVRPDGTSFGVLADTTYRCRMDLTMDIVFAAEGPEFPIYVFEGDTPQEVLGLLADYTGHIQLPPLWALGYQQSRYSYAPESYARWIANEFRNRDIPCDVIWFDIDYMDGYRIFTFDPVGFPDPANLNSDLHAMGYHTVWMIDPGVKVENGYFVDDQGSAGDHWVYNDSGSWYTGQVWPGQCHFPDFTRPETRTWWASLYFDFMSHGIDGVWNDMNEPGIFDGPGHSMPVTCQHRGGGGLPAGPHRQYHNVYGRLMVEASHAGISAANPTKRPFVLSRANFIGGQRFAAMWTGDNVATWDHLYYSTPMVLNMGLSGQPFAGPDLGGFAADGTADLFARWMGVGVFMPFARAHADNAGIDKEPWSFGTSVENTCRTAIQRRYRLLPYYYTLFHEASLTGLPVVRPVFFADLTDPDLRDEDVAFLIGDDVLVVPNIAEQPGSASPPDLPDGIWRTVSLVGETSASDVNQPDLKIRGGAIVPLGPVMEYTGEQPLDPLTLLVSLDDSGQADGWLYEDAGDGYGYQQGAYRHARYAASRVGNQVQVTVSETLGDLAAPVRQVEIVILTDGGTVTAMAPADADAGLIATVQLP